MREPVNPTDIGVKTDEEILREAIQAAMGEQEGKHVYLYYEGRQIRLHPLSAGILVRGLVDNLCGAYVAAMQELEPEMTRREGFD